MKIEREKGNKTSIHIKYARMLFKIAPCVLNEKCKPFLLCSRNVHFMRTTKKSLATFQSHAMVYYNCVTNSYHFFNTSFSLFSFSSLNGIRERIVIVLFGVWFEIWGRESAMRPVPSFQINWNGLSVSQMFYISHDGMLFYRTHAHTHTRLLAHSVEYQVKCSYNSKIDATAAAVHTAIVVQTVFKVYILQLWCCCYYC